MNKPCNKGHLPIERRALALILRQAERDGICSPPRDLAELAAQMPCSDDEIDYAFVLFVNGDGGTLGGTLTVDEIHEEWAAELVEAGLIPTPDSREFSEKGRRLNEPFTEYAAPHHKWKSLVFEGDLPR